MEENTKTRENYDENLEEVENGLEDKYVCEPYKCELCTDFFISLHDLRIHSFEGHDLIKYLTSLKENVSVLKYHP
jgi:hypothetical protein